MTPATSPVFAPRTVMLSPSGACQANCKYCFMPHEGQIMSHEVFSQAMDFLDGFFSKDQCFTLLFHGGEPMLPGLEWYREALPLVRKRFGYNVDLSMQSNIWLLNREWLNLFREYNVSVSTSIDGPEDLCDSQRGKGYFERTMKSIRLMKENGLRASAIATVGKKNISREKCRRLFRFFVDEDIHFSLHGAVASIERGFSDQTLTAAEMLQVFRYMSEIYFADYQQTSMGTIDHIVQNIYRKKSGLCTFSNCLGSYLAIAPDGYLYTCQRFCGIKELSVGKLSDHPTPESILSSKGYTELDNLYRQAHEICTQQGCKHLAYCNGGCCYTSFAAKKHNREWNGRDPFCEAYRTFYDELEEKLTEEMVNDLLKKDLPAPLLSIAENRKRSYMAKENIRKILEAYHWQKAPACVEHKNLETVYLNISGEMPAETILKTIDEAFALGFRQFIFTGGESLFLRDAEKLWAALSEYVKTHRTPRLILRTTNEQQCDENIRTLRRIAPHIQIVFTGKECSECTEYVFNPDSIYKPFRPKIKCSIGNQLHIEPDGSIYSCYVYINKENYMGNVSDEKALDKAIRSDIFSHWRNTTVDAHPKCRACDVRYLCGGVCKIKTDCGQEYRYYKKLVDLAQEMEEKSCST
ncbi:MAG: SPASM domain-containing protein [Dysgonamonadaceae bacterium]|jgi:uncharacterized protein|nr:SPASM domain-containing protein [Dysgonamonadaceae bacterium]